MNHPLPPTSQDPAPARATVQATRQRRLTPDETEDLVNRYRAGSSTRELATECGLHRHTISRRLAAEGVYLRAKQRRFDDAAIDKARQLYQEGWTLARLASEYDVGRETIRRELINSGLELRPRGSRR
ncbi:MAG: hypothetical protein GY788_26760 [bacterium]|nr:hypothetical protein [bacterium]